MGGRIVLIKSVLNSLPSYFFALYRAPMAIIQKLDKIRRNFLWGGSERHNKIHWVAWEKVIQPKENGGLGLGSLSDINLCLLAKWWWRFKVEYNSLWGRVIASVHHVTIPGDLIPSKPIISGVWNNIIKIDGLLHRRGLNLKVMFKGVVGDGRSLKFWSDLWIGEIPLCFKFKKLFKLERNKLCSIHERMSIASTGQELKWEWSRVPNEEQQKEELEALEALLSDLKLSTNKDRWVWLGSNDMVFSVKSLKQRLTNETNGSFVLKWCKWVPAKANIVAWRAEMNRLPTRLVLRRRGVAVDSTACPMCNEGEETAEHLIIGCPFANEVWQSLSQWCKIPPIYAFEIKDLLQLSNSLNEDRSKKDLLHAVIICGLWCIWKTRNEIVFKGTSPSVGGIVEEVKRMGFLWIKNRAKLHSLDWNRWKCFNVNFGV
ncbi:hypothetical protein E3N88_27886 [Mikania micrantha]|uniref:Reverse transcriptase zinc-binding domain-containing protein n=1 Tax=Mikania micrantha TaxID=192012 RepID=A0A5N6N0S9_9ASTR|nr:hypothetical protein E3N88_27886 [Mikania micrantha]